MMTDALWIIPLGLAVIGLGYWIVPVNRLGWVSGIAGAFLLFWLAALPLRLWQGTGPLATWFFVIVAILSIFGIWYSGPYITREAKEHHWAARRVKGYYLFFMLFIGSLAALAIWTNFIFLWMAIEGATLTSTVLTAHPASRGAVEAAWKYIVVTELGGLVALLGTILSLTAVGSPLFAWSFVPAHQTLSGVHQHWALIGAYMALVGYGTKAGLAPFHTWLPDAHSEAPAPVSALLSGLKLAGAMFIVYRLFHVLALSLPSAYLQDALILLGLLSLVIAAGSLTFQRDLKRLWAYSSIEHIGLISLGMGFGGIALVGAFLHIWTHAASKTLLFHNAGTVRILYHSSHSEHGARGILHRTPWTGALLALGSAAIVGLPPFAPFWSEWLILAGGLHQVGDRPVAIAAAALVVLIFIAIARRVPGWLFTPGQVGASPVNTIQEPMGLILPSAVLGVFVLAGGIGFPLLVHPLWHHVVSQLATVHL
ncbi:proton-conducting transporter membrane subunit [Sulfobacillus harzensis]|uniref:Nitroreductase family protein n=1 Tax=Sulfobacillus harzensis TaxID=2729629 RepID=A0A7Y0L261_9FIRM|nr:proton-conducting transporter membrane subunit [Sulfobacillus harzensis]NMP21942.1 nitroreductase family protein [Sulfobacillus harzensis]